MKVIRQIIRGCGNLPHVGEHPGTLTLIFFIFLGCMAGKGEWGFTIGGSIMAAFMVPIYLFGAYDRAEESDRIESAVDFKSVSGYNSSIKTKRSKS